MKLHAAAISLLLTLLAVAGLLLIATEEVFAEAVETAAFDLFIEKEYKGLLAARYSTEFNSTWVEIENPSDAVSQLPAIKDSAKLVELLSGRIEGERTIPNFGTVKVAPKAFIITVTLVADQLVSTSLEEKQEVRKIESKLSFRQDLSGSTVVGDTESAKALSSASSLSYGSSWLYSNFSAFSKGRSNLQEITANRLFGRYRGSAGGIRGAGDRLIPSLDIYGAGVATVNELLPLDRALRGNDFQIFVSTPGRVEFFRSGQLIDSQMLEYGLQAVDTTRFPDGSYYIDVVQRGAIQGVSGERKFFSRSGLLVPRGFPTIAGEIGVLRDQFKGLDTPAFHLSTDWRASDWLQLELGGYGIDDDAVGVPGFRALADGVTFGASIATPVDGELGYGFDISGKFLALDWSGSFEKSSFLNFPAENSIEEIQQLFVPVNQVGQRERLLRAGETYTVSVGRRFGFFDLRYEAYSASDGLLDEFFYRGPVLRWQVAESTDHIFNVQLARYDTQFGARYYALLSYQYRMGKWQNQVQGWYQKDDARRDVVGSNVLSYDGRQQRSGIGTRGQFRSEVRNSGDSNQTNGSIDITHGFSPGSVAIYGQRSAEGLSAASGGSVLSSTVGTAFTLGEDGTIAFSPPDLAQSLLVVNLEADSDDVEMDVMIDDYASGTLKGDGKITIGISAYQPHKVRIRPTERSSLVNYDTKIITVSANAGGVVHASFGVDRIFVALGRLVGADGNPLAFKRIRGAKEPPLTDKDGNFQLELQGGEVLEADTDSGRCRIDLQIEKKVEFLIEVGDVVCR